MFGRLLVRERLNLVVVVPLVAVLLTAVPLAAGRVDEARGSARVSQVVTRATLTAALVGELQRERQLSVLYLGAAGADRGVLTGQSQRVAAAAAAVAGPRGTLPALDGLTSVRRSVVRRTARPDAVLTAYAEVVDALLGQLGSARQLLAGAPNGSEVAALLSLLDADEQTSLAGATLLALAVGGDPPAQVAARHATARALGRRLLDQFRQGSRPEQAALVDATLRGPAEARVDALARSLQAPGRAGELAGDTSGRLARLYTAVETQVGLRRVLEDRVASRVAANMAARERTARLAAAGVIGGSALLFLLVALLSVVVGRSIVQPLRRLSGAVRTVTQVAQAELLRVADDENEDEAPPRLAAVDLGSADELGELATAINQVQATAALLLDRQIASRRNVATMLGNIGRRTQNLVGRQLAMIDQLERGEQDPEVLDRLYRLDHVSVRLRRSANSLLVLSGGGDPGMSGLPLSVTDVLRSALQEIEGFQRVRLDAVDDAMIVPDAIPDLVLLLAELLENSTSFSPPNETVQVNAKVGDDGVLIRIVDHGIGLTEEQLAAENERLVRRERLDLAPTDVLGLFVVGRLARRHGIEVALRPSPGTGITAEVRLPAGLVVPRSRPRPAGSGGPGMLRAGSGGPGTLPAGAGGPGMLPAVPVPPGPALRMPAPARDWWEPARPAAEPIRPGAPGTAVPLRGALGTVQVARPALPAPTPPDSVSAPRPSAPPGAAGGGPGDLPPLLRRIPGAQHPPDAGLPRASEAAPVLDPLAAAEAARALVREFEAGAGRAQDAGADADAGGTAEGSPG